MAELWKVAFGLAGIGAIAAFVLWSLYREWLRLPIFQQMTKEQQFRLFVLFLTFAFLFGLAGLTAYAYVSTSNKTSLGINRHAEPNETDKIVNNIIKQLNNAEFKSGRASGTITSVNVKVTERNGERVVELQVTFSGKVQDQPPKPFRGQATIIASVEGSKLRIRGIDARGRGSGFRPLSSSQVSRIARQGLEERVGKVSVE